MYRKLLLTASLLAAIATTAVATPAQAESGDIIVITDQGGLNSVAKKGLDVTCPYAMDVIGGGGYIEGGGRRVHLSNSAPVDGGVHWDQWEVGGAELAGSDYTASWRVHGYAICGSFISGLEYVTVDSAENSTSPKHARATCPGTKKLLSGGGQIWDAAESVVLDDIAYTSDLKNVDVWAIEREGGTTRSWSVHAYAVCADANAVGHLNLVQVTSASNVSDKSVDASCGGQQVYGIGVSQAMAAGQTLLQSLSLSDIDGHTSVRTDDTGTPTPYTVTTQLICGDE